MNRLQILQDFYEQDPTDPFNIYGLALEYQKHDSLKSIDLFNVLMTNFKEYLATYYIAAKLHEEMGLEEKALVIYKNGILIAQSQKNTKTENELKNALINLEMEML